MSLSGVVCLRWLCKRGQIDWTWKMLSFRHIHNTSAHQRTHTLTRSGQTKCAWSWIHDHWSWYGFQIDFCSHLSLCRHTLRVCEWCSLVLLLCCLALPCFAQLHCMPFYSHSICRFFNRSTWKRIFPQSQFRYHFVWFSFVVDAAAAATTAIAAFCWSCCCGCCWWWC